MSFPCRELNYDRLCMKNAVTACFNLVKSSISNSGQMVVKRHIDQAGGLIPPSVNYIGNIREKIKFINPEIDIIIFIAFIISL